MKYSPINLREKFSIISEYFSPKIIAQMNDYYFKLCKFKGDFIWHTHEDTDETFLVISGEMRIDFRDGDVTLRSGEMFVVPKGVEHKPFAGEECQIMLIEPAGTKNTGDTKSDMEVEENVWI